ncbi:MAG: type VI secretion system tip protein VgrG [Bacteroidota bacterium]
MSNAKTSAGIKINGSSSELPLTEAQILSITVSKEVNKIPTAVLTLKDGLPNKQDFPISNLPNFQPGTEIEILLGERNDRATVFRGIITKHSLQVKKDKPSILTVECKDETVRLTIGRRSRFWLDKSDSDIFQEIYEDYAGFQNMGLEAEDSNDIIVHDQMSQYYSTDWDFMVMRAEALAKYMFIDDGLLSIQQPDLGQNEAFTLSYGLAADSQETSRIWELDTEMDARQQFASVETLGWDYASQEVTQANQDFDSASEAGNISSDELTSIIGLDTYRLHHHARMKEEELTALANAVKQKSVLNKNRGRIKFDGRADIKPGQLVNLQGVGDRFNGKVFVSRVFHTFQLGRWFTQIQFGLPFRWFHEESRIANPPAQGLLPAIKGLHVGTVIKIKDEDRPADRLDKNFRIKVNISGVHEQNEGVWARLASFYASVGFGAVFLPELNDEVVIGYVGQDGREPVVLGSLYSEAHSPPFVNDDDNFLKGIVTRNGHKFQFDEEKDIITLQTNGGHSIVLSDEKKEIVTTDSNGNTITLDKEGIHLNSKKNINIEASKDITIKGMNVSIVGQTSVAVNNNQGGPVLLGAGILPVARMMDASPPPNFQIITTNVQVKV